jgi:hypothetical protein
MTLGPDPGAAPMRQHSVPDRMMRSWKGRPTIVVGYDGSEASRAAVTFAARRAGRSGRVFVVHDFDLPPDFLGHLAGSSAVGISHMARGSRTGVSSADADTKLAKAIAPV